MSTHSWDTRPTASASVIYPSRMNGGCLTIGLFLNEDEVSYTLKGKFCEFGDVWPDDDKAEIISENILRSDADIPIPATIRVSDGEGGLVDRDAVLKYPPSLGLLIGPDRGIVISINGEFGLPSNGINNAHRWGHEE